MISSKLQRLYGRLSKSELRDEFDRLRKLSSAWNQEIAWLDRVNDPKNPFCENELDRLDTAICELQRQKDKIVDAVSNYESLRKDLLEQSDDAAERIGVINHLLKDKKVLRAMELVSQLQELADNNPELREILSQTVGKED